MTYYSLDPEVAGGWGDDTEADTSVHPPIISKLHYEFEGWLGDVLLESFPSWIVTVPTMEQIQSAKLTGATFANVKVTTSGLFQDMYPGRRLPKFVWLKVDGKPGHDDFVQGLGISHAIIEPYTE